MSLLNQPPHACAECGAYLLERITALYDTTHPDGTPVTIPNVELEVCRGCGARYISSKMLKHVSNCVCSLSGMLVENARNPQSLPASAWLDANVRPITEMEFDRGTNLANWLYAWELTIVEGGRGWTWFNVRDRIEEDLSAITICVPVVSRPLRLVSDYYPRLSPTPSSQT